MRNFDEIAVIGDLTAAAALQNHEHLVRESRLADSVINMVDISSLKCGRLTTTTTSRSTAGFRLNSKVVTRRR